MTSISKVFPSVRCNADYVQNLAEEAVANGYLPILPEKCGHALLNQCLVPFTFLERVQQELQGMIFQYVVLTESDIFTEGFLASLEEKERSVLMPAVMLLIERGDFELNLFETADEGKAA